jgi:uncharacterized membrane protein
MVQRWDPGRTEAFSDGVFAIAITLLVLDVGVPQREFGDLWYGIGHQWPSYLAYITSFATIGGIWMVHQALFSRLRYASRRVMQVNLLLLMAVSFLPFPTGLMAEAIRHSDAERAAVLFYGANLFVIQALVGALWTVASRDRSLLRPEVSEEEARALRDAVTPNLGFYVVATAIGVVAPHVAAFGYLLIALVLVGRARGDQERRAATA